MEKTRKEVRHIDGTVAVDKKKKRHPMYHMPIGWFQRFMQRHPHLSYRKGDPTANVRMNCLSKEMISDYFQLLIKVPTEISFLIHPVEFIMLMRWE